MLAKVLKPLSGNRKRESAQTAIRSLAQRIGPEMKLPTIQEFCGSLNVAKATIDTALDALEIEGVIRRRRGSGIFVTPQIAQKSIGLVFGHNIFDMSVSPFYALLMRRCRERAVSHDERFSFFIDPLPGEVAGGEPPVHRDLANAIEAGRLHGILLVARNSEEEESWLRAQDVPVVSLGLDGSDRPLVAIDQNEFVRIGVEALFEKGCRRIGLILPYSRDSLVGSKIIRAFDEELRLRGLVNSFKRLWAPPEWPEIAAETPQECGRIAFDAIFGSQSVPDGLIIGDDMYTRGALSAAKDRGVEIGHDVKIASHANRGSPVLVNCADGISLIEVDPNEVVEAMFEILESLMAEKSVACTTILVKPRLKTYHDAIVGNAHPPRTCCPVVL